MYGWTQPQLKVFVGKQMDTSRKLAWLNFKKTLFRECVCVEVVLQYLQILYLVLQGLKDWFRSY
jgi:hypothetical protein